MEDSEQSEAPIELPNPLILNGVDYPPSFKQYIRNRGGQWEDREQEQKSYIFLPKNAYIEEIEYKGAQVFISFPDGGFIVWFRLQRTDPEELYSRLNIPRDAFDLVGEVRDEYNRNRKST